VTTFLLCLVCAVLVWGLMLRWAKRQIAATRDQAQLTIQYLKRQEVVATGQVARLVRESALWDEAWRRGRDDAIAIIPLIDDARSHDRDYQEAPGPQEGAA
jgi:hypothetical protein